MPGLIGKKIGMTSVFNDDRKAVACTLIECGPCVVTQVKTDATDGYPAVQVAYGDKKAKNLSKAVKGHLAKAGIEAAALLREFDLDPTAYKIGDEIKVELFQVGEFVDVVGTSKGKGFQGAVKRHGFAGVGGQTHGQHNRQRAPGSMGAASYPSRVFKGKRLPGQMGNVRVKVQNLQVLKVIPEQNVLVVSGAIPGAKGSFVLIEK